MLDLHEFLYSNLQIRPSWETTAHGEIYHQGGPPPSQVMEAFPQGGYIVTHRDGTVEHLVSEEGAKADRIEKRHDIIVQQAEKPLSKVCEMVSTMGAKNPARVRESVLRAVRRGDDPQLITNKLILWGKKKGYNVYPLNNLEFWLRALKKAYDRIDAALEQEVAPGPDDPDDPNVCHHSRARQDKEIEDPTIQGLDNVKPGPKPRLELKNARMALDKYQDAILAQNSRINALNVAHRAYMDIRDRMQPGGDLRSKFDRNDLHRIIGAMVALVEKVEKRNPRYDTIGDVSFIMNGAFLRGRIPKGIEDGMLYSRWDWQGLARNTKPERCIFAKKAASVYASFDPELKLNRSLKILAGTRDKRIPKLRSKEASVSYVAVSAACKMGERMQNQYNQERKRTLVYWDNMVKCGEVFTK